MSKVKLSELELQKTYKALLREFLKESSIHGLKLLLYRTPVRYAKKLWIVFIIIVLIAAHIIILLLFLNFMEQPTEIHMSTKLVHVANSPFPAVAVCSANKISKRKLMAYAEKVFISQEKYKRHLLANNSMEMAEHLLKLTGLYIYPYDDYEVDYVRLEKLHEILTQMYNTTKYPTKSILRDLAPDCDGIVLRGIIYGQHIDISKLFYKRLISHRVCCMFNYQRESNADEPEIKARDELIAKEGSKIRFEANNILNGIQFVLQDDPDDFVLSQYANNAFQLYILPTHDFAPQQSNAVGEIFIDHSTIVEIPIQPMFFDASNSTRSFSPESRQCYFPEEGQSVLNKSFNRAYYSLDECLLICRMQSMANYCGCVNPSGAFPIANATVCNLLDLPCLMEWKRIWYRLKQFSILAEEENENNRKSAFSNCDYCLPTCNGVKFQIDNNKLPLRKSSGRVYSRGLLKGLSSDKPLAIIKLYFKNRYAEATEEDIVGNWVVLLNRFGGVMSLLYGFGIVSYIEIIYYSTGKWGASIFQKYQLRVQQKLNPIIQSNRREVVGMRPDNDMLPPAYSLYWKEFKVKPAFNLNQPSKF